MFKSASTRSAESAVYDRSATASARVRGILLSIVLTFMLFPAPALAIEGEPIYADDRIVVAADETPDAWDFFAQVPNGYGADAIKVLDLSPLKEYTHRGSETDATSLANMLASVQWLKKCNDLRAQNGLDPYLVNYTLVAIAMTDANWSAVHPSDGHANVFNAGENLSWGYTDPFVGWYDEEKAEYDAGNRNFGDVGHYLNIINPKNAIGSSMTYKNTGFATVEGGPYPISYCQTFGSTESYWNPGIDHSLPAGLTFGDATAQGNVTVAEYERQLNAFAEGNGYEPSGEDGDTGSDIGSGIQGSSSASTSANQSNQSNQSNAAGSSQAGATSAAETSDIPGKTSPVQQTGDASAVPLALALSAVAFCVVLIVARIRSKYRSIRSFR